VIHKREGAPVAGSALECVSCSAASDGLGSTTIPADFQAARAAQRLGRRVLLFSRALFPDWSGLPPYWLEEWDGVPGSKRRLVWLGASYHEARASALGISTDVVDFCADYCGQCGKS